MDASLQNIGDLAVGQATAAKIHLGRLGRGANIDKTANDFEGVFLSQMLQPMFESVGVDNMFGGGHGEEMMRSFLVQEYGKIAAKTSSLGIADAVKKEMIRAQEAGQAKPTTPNPGAYDAAQF